MNTETQTPEKQKEALNKLNDEVREQVKEELGEEATQDERFQLLQKYGIAKPVLTGKMNPPSWLTKEELKLWKKVSFNSNQMTLPAWEKLVRKSRAPEEKKRPFKKAHKPFRPANHPRFKTFQKSS